jgi:hypothetical protein
MFLMIFCFPVKLIANECIDKIKKYKNDRHNNNKTTTTATTTASVSFIPAKAVKLRTKIVCLTIFIVLSIVLVIIPHLPTINKDNQQIGVDSRLYVNWVGNLTNTDSAQDFLHEAFNLQAEGTRPLALIFLFAIMKIIGTVDPFFIFEYLPIILGPALVSTTYFLSRELTSNDVTSLFASFLTAVSFQMLIGIYAGFYANWLALICGYLAAMFLIRFLKIPSKFNYALFSVLITLLLLIHVFTWSTFVIVFFVFIVAMMILKRYPRRNAVLLLLVVISTVALDVARTSFTGSTGGVIQNLNIPGTGIGSEEFSKHWKTLVETVHISVGGMFSNFVILGLCLYWLFFSKMQKTSDTFIIIFMSVGILPLFFGDWIIQTRILYNTPFQIPAAIALARISNRGHMFRVFLPAIVIWLVAMSVTSVSNFYQIPPS